MGDEAKAHGVRWHVQEYIRGRPDCTRYVVSFPFPKRARQAHAIEKYTPWPGAYGSSISRLLVSSVVVVHQEMMDASRDGLSSPNSTTIAQTYTLRLPLIGRSRLNRPRSAGLAHRPGRADGHRAHWPDGLIRSPAAARARKKDSAGE